MITSADIERNGFAWTMVDDMRKRMFKRGKPFIINTDISGNQGVHWITAVLADDNKWFIYDM